MNLALEIMLLLSSCVIIVHIVIHLFTPCQPHILNTVMKLNHYDYVVVTDPETFSVWSSSVDVALIRELWVFGDTTPYESQGINTRRWSDASEPPYHKHRKHLFIGPLPDCVDSTHEHV